MSERFEVGDRIEVDDKSRVWAHTEPGIILATYPPGSDDPVAYELLVAGRPLQLPASSLRRPKEE